MTNQASDTQAETWSAADASPLGWIALGVLVAVAGIWLTGWNQEIGVGVVGLGALPTLVGVIAYGVELGLRRSGD